MAKHLKTGSKGEALALQFLKDKGYDILHTNWRCSHKEVDIIARNDQFLVFVEIKTRSNLECGFPEESVTSSKQSHLRAAALYYIEEFPSDLNIRFDVISIVLNGERIADLKHFEEAF